MFARVFSVAFAAVVIVLVSGLFGCGATQAQVTGGAAVAAQGCEVVLTATDPTLEPLCVLAQQVFDWTVALANLPPSQLAPGTTKRDQLYQYARAHGAKTVSGK